MTDIAIAIAGGNHQSFFDLATAVQKDKPQYYFYLYGVGQPVSDIPSNMSYFECQDLTESIDQALKSIAENQTQVLLKGLVQTHQLLSAVLKSPYQLRDQKVLSHIALLEIPGYARPLFLTDAAMNIAPDAATLIEIVKNAIRITTSYGLKQPKVALLSAAENINPKMPSSVMAQKVTEYFQDNTTPGIVYGPLSLDLALSPQSAVRKGFKGPIKGDADVLVVPAIDAGNVLYKALTLFTDVKVGGLIIGTKVPVVLNSRSDSIENKISALNFAAEVLVDQKEV